MNLPEFSDNTLEQKVNVRDGLSDLCHDFVSDLACRDERAHYDAEHEIGWSKSVPLAEVDFLALWKQEPDLLRLLESLGDLKDKKVLLLGNGTSIKEAEFIRKGATCYFTDLSIVAMQKTRDRFLAWDWGRTHLQQVRFHAVNAYFLPYENDSFDVIYGVAFVHHLENLNALFSEIYRCLKPGGICRFADTAYSPLWQGAKSTLLRPLQMLVHKKHGISPEDMKATQRGGYTEEEIRQLRDKIGFRTMVFDRFGIFDYLLWRARVKLYAPWLLPLRPLTRTLDSALRKHTNFIRRHGITLVLGFDK